MMGDSLDKAIAIGLMVVIVLTALAHGVVEPWSMLIFELMAAALALMWAIKAVADRRLALAVPQPVWPLTGLVALGLAQSLAWTDAAGNGRSLSLDVETTRGTVMILLCLLVCALVAANFLASRARLEKLARFLAGYGMALAIFAIIQYFTWNDRLFWLRRISGDNPFGPFVNRNHFAGYLELLLPWPVALMLLRRASSEERFFYGFAAVWMGVAVVVSLSRGGMISVFAELMMIAALGARVNGDERAHETTASRGRALALRLGAVAAILIAIAGGVLWLGAERVINRIATGQESATPSAQASQTFSSSRGELWRGSWAVFRAHPIAGVGLGAFEIAYPIYGDDIGLGRVTGEAHNDYLQILADGGIIGGGLALGFIIVLWRAVRRGLRSHDPLPRAVTLACGASLFGLLVHSLFDFNLQLPSHALLFVALAAIVCQVSATVTEPIVAREPQAPAAGGLPTGRGALMSRCDALKQ